MKAKPISDRAFLAVCELVLMARDDPEQLELAEYMLCDMAMTRRKQKLSGELSKPKGG